MMSGKKIIGQWSYVLLATVLLAVSARALADSNVCTPTPVANYLAISGVINLYYPGTGNPNVGDTTITVGTKNVLSPPASVVIGDTVLIMQMQDATINATNSNNYGSNTGDRNGSTALNSTGLYEYKVVKSINGNVIEFTSPLGNAYHSGAQSTYQMVVVPQYAGVKISGTVTSAPWNGSSGGIVAFDSRDTIFSGLGRVDVTGQGFRGGFIQDGGCNRATASYDLDQIMNPPNPTGQCSGGVAAPGRSSGYKGEGIAGTPDLIFNLDTTNPTTYTNTTPGSTINLAYQALGLTTGRSYPGGDTGLGAPGNAGGGGSADDSAGGGGGNAGYGNNGGYWSNWKTPGGAGGDSYAASISSSRFFMGGGGGGGSVQVISNNKYARPGSPGGGIIMIRSEKMTGGIFAANGVGGGNGAGDGSGGAGAGGSIMVSVNSSSGSATLNANGGNSFPPGSAYPGTPLVGGAGGGGAVFTNLGTYTANMNKGTQLSASALTTAVNTYQGVQQVVSSGTSGASNAGTIVLCTPQLTVTKSVSSNPLMVDPTGALNQYYTLNVAVSNADTSSAISLVDSLPSGITLSGAPSVIAGGVSLSGCASSGSSLGAGCAISTVPIAAGTTVQIKLPIAVAGTATNAANMASATGGGSACTGTSCSGSVSADVQPTIKVSKTSNGGYGDFAFSASGGITTTPTSQTITTTALTMGTPVLGGTTYGGTIGTAATVSETAVPANWPGTATSITCTDANAAKTGNAVVTATNAASIQIPASEMVSGANFTCAFVNSIAPKLTVTKVANGSFVVGTPASYTLTVSNTGTAATTAIATITDTLDSGFTIGSLPAGCSAVSQTVTCTVASGLAVSASESFTIPVTPTVALADTSVNNTASVSGGSDSTCPGASRCSSTISTSVAGAPKLSLSKSAGSALFAPGVASSYVLTVTNTGTTATTVSATVTDTISSDFTLGSMPSGCTNAGQAVTCTIAAGLAVNASVSFTIPVTLNLNVVATSETNTANVSGGGDPLCTVASPCTATITTPVGAGTPLLHLLKSVSPSSLVAGQGAIYTLQVTNAGTAPTDAVATITDALPASLTVGTLPTGCTVNSQTVTCTVASGLPAGSTTSFAIPVTVSGVANNSSITNSASISGGGDSSCPAAGHCTSTVTASASAPQLKMTKMASTTSMVVGVAASYALEVTNIGAAATTASASVVDTIPAGLTIGTLPGGCSAVGQQVTCTIAGGLAAGASVSFLIPVTPTLAAVGSVGNTARVSGGGDPSCPGAAGCTGTAITAVSAPQLTMTKSASSTSFVLGVAASYTLVVTNTGTAASTAVATLTDSVPANLTLGTLPAGCSASGQTVNCTVAAGLAVGASASFVIAVTPNAAGTVVNSATVSGGGDNACPGASYCTSTVTTGIDAPALSLVKTAGSTSFVSGVASSYTLTLSNIGTAATTAVATIADNIPSNLTLGTMPSGCSTSGQLVTCTVAAGLAPGAVVSFVLPVTPTGTAMTVTNTASVSGGGDPACPAASTCSSTISTGLNAAKLRLVKTASSASFVVGVADSYVLQVSNIGSAATTAAAIVTDNVPAGLTIGTLPGGCSRSGQTLSCTVPSGFGVGALMSFVIPVTATSSANGSSLSNTATIVGGGDPSCPGAANCSSTIATAVTAPQLTMTKTASSSGMTAGGTYSYILKLTNTGTAATTAPASITDNVPSALTIVSVSSGCMVSGQTVSCSVPAGLTAGANAIFTVVVSVPAGATSGSALQNTATVSGGGDGSCPDASRCSSTVTTTIQAPLLTLAKTSSVSGVVAPGNFSYNLTLTNSGTAATTATTTIADILPAGLTLNGSITVSNSGNYCSSSATNPIAVSCSVPAGVPAANGGSLIITIPVSVTSAGTLSNTATASGGGDPSCSGSGSTRCSATNTVGVTAPALKIVKTASGVFAVGSPNAAYVLTVSNVGSAATTAAILVTDNVPVGMTISSTPTVSTVTDTCSVTGQTVSCGIAGLAAGASATITIAVSPQASLGATTVTNTATAVGGGDPACNATANCRSSISNGVVGIPVLTLTKSASTSPFVVGVAASYSLTLTNSGTAATTTVTTISDTLPTHLTVSGTITTTDSFGTKTTCSASGTPVVVSCSVPAGNLTTASGAQASITITIPVVASAAANGTQVSNTATASGGGDPLCTDSGNCTAGPVVTSVTAPNLTLTKAASASSFTVGVAASYTLTLSNSATVATTAVTTISDVLPTNLTVSGSVTDSNSGNYCSTSGAEPITVTCSVPAGVPAANGGSLTITIPVTASAAANGTTLSNTATASGGGDPTCAASGTCSAGPVTTPVIGPVLTVTKTASATSFVVDPTGAAGQYYTISVAVTSAATISAISLNDSLPSGITLFGAPSVVAPASGVTLSGCPASGATSLASCGLSSPIAAGTTVQVKVPVAVATSATTGTNAASVSGGGSLCDGTVSQPASCSGTTSPVTITLADMAVTENTLPTNITGGQSVSGEITCTNNGPSVAVNATCSISGLPSGATVNCTPSATVASLAAGATITCTVTYTAPSNTGVSATITAGSDTFDPYLANNTLSYDAIGAPVLSLSKAASSTSFVVGAAASYTLTLTNTGNASTSVAATISDTIPSTLTIGTLPTACTAASQVVTCTVAGGMAAGTSVSFVIPVTPLPAASGTSLSNSATVTGGGDSTCPSATHCNAGPVITPVNAPQLTVTKSASATSFVVNVPASYTVTVTNTGTAATTAAATVTDQLPAGLTVGAMPSGCSLGGDGVTVSCTVAAGLGTGSQVSFTIPVTPTSAVNGQTLANSATVVGGGDPSCPGGSHCTSTTVSTTVNAPQLKLTKSASSTSFVINVPASYVLMVTNIGTAATTVDATITDTVPAQLTLGTLPAGCTAIGQALSCTVPAGLAVGEVTGFTIPVTPMSAASGSTQANTASISGGGDPSCPGAANCSSATSTAVNAPKLLLVKTASSSSFVVGVAASYTLTLTNTGTAATTVDASITDNVPMGLSITGTPSGCTVNGQTVTCTVAAGMSAGAVRSFVIAVMPTAAVNGQTLANTATVSGGGDPSCPAASSCTSSVSTTVNAPQLKVVKAAPLHGFVLNVAGDYTLTVTNIGSAATMTAATVTDNLPANLNLGTLPAGCVASGSTIQVVTCTIPAGFAAGAVTSFAITVTPTAGASGDILANQAGVIGGGDPNCPGAANCTSTIYTGVARPLLSITNTASSSSLVVGESGSFTLTVTNIGNAATTAVTLVTDLVPAGLTIGTLPSNCTASGQLVSCSLPAGLAVDTQVQLVIPVTATAPLAGSTVADPATVIGGGDPTCPVAARCMATSVVTVTLPPPPPTIDPLIVGSSTVTGTCVAGDTVTVAQCTAAVICAANNTFSCTTISPITAGEVVTATQSNASGSSGPATTVAPTAGGINPPTVEPAGTTGPVSGTGIPGAQVTVTLPGGATCSPNPVTVSANGTWTCTVTGTMPVGSVISATQTLGGLTSGPATNTVSGGPTGLQPSIADTTPGASSLSGTGQPGSIFTVVDQNGAVICTSTVLPDGTWTCTGLGPTVIKAGATLSVTTAGPNGMSGGAAITIVPPVAVNTSVSLNPGTNGTTNLISLSNVSGGAVKIAPGSSFSVVSGAGTTCSGAGVDASGVVSYTAPSLALQSCTVTVKVCDPAPNGLVCVYDVVTVTAMALPITANPDRAGTSQDTPVTVTTPVTANDVGSQLRVTDLIGANGQTCSSPMNIAGATRVTSQSVVRTQAGSSCVVNGQPGATCTVSTTHGSVTMCQDGTYTYTPNVGYVGSDSFQYIVTDSAGGRATATVTLTVSPLAAIPVDAAWMLAMLMVLLTLTGGQKIRARRG